MTERNPTIDDIQRAARKFRHHNSVMDLRAVLERVTGEALTVVSDVPPEKRAAVIAALEGEIGASAFVTPEGELDARAIYARFSAAGKRSAT